MWARGCKSGGGEPGEEARCHPAEEEGARGRMNQGGVPQSLEGITDSRSDLAWCLGTGTLGGKEQGVGETGWGILGENGDMNLPMLRVGLLCPTVNQWESFLQRYETSHY